MEAPHALRDRRRARVACLPFGGGIGRAVRSIAGPAPPLRDQLGPAGPGRRGHHSRRVPFLVPALAAGPLPQQSPGLDVPGCPQSGAERRAQARTGAQLIDQRASLADLVLDPNPSPEEQIATSQRRQRVLAVASALPEQDRRGLIPRAEGLRYREIAEVLDISLGSVALSLGRCLTCLARAAQG